MTEEKNEFKNFLNKEGVSLESLLQKTFTIANRLSFLNNLQENTSKEEYDHVFAIAEGHLTKYVEKWINGEGSLNFISKDQEEIFDKINTNLKAMEILAKKFKLQLFNLKIIVENGKTISIENGFFGAFFENEKIEEKDQLEFSSLVSWQADPDDTGAKNILKMLGIQFDGSLKIEGFKK